MPVIRWLVVQEVCSRFEFARHFESLIKDIKKLEKPQRRATKFILGYHLSGLDYKDRLIQLNLLPLMYFFELADIMFLVNSLKNPSDHFNILNYVQMQDQHTRSSDKPSLKHIRCSSNQFQHFYFNRLPRLWNKLPAVDLSESYNPKSVKPCGPILFITLTLVMSVHFTFFVHVSDAQPYHLQCHIPSIIY